MLVLDASAILELLFQTTAGRRIARRLGRPRLSLHAPHLIDLEIAQALRRYVRDGRGTVARAEIALNDLAALAITRWPHLPLLPRIWALRQNLTAYDAAYVALAEALRAPLMTLDRRIAAAPGLLTRIETP